MSKPSDHIGGALSDGKPLFAISHPTSFWRRIAYWLWYRWRTPMLNESSIEDVEIEIGDLDPYDGY